MGLARHFPANTLRDAKMASSRFAQIAWSGSVAGWKTRVAAIPDLKGNS